MPLSRKSKDDLIIHIRPISNIYLKYFTNATYGLRSGTISSTDCIASQTISVCRKSLEVMSCDLSSLYDNLSPTCDSDEEGTFTCSVPEKDSFNRSSPSDIAEAFNTFTSLILDDDVVDYKEAVELRCFLSVIPPTYGVERLGAALDAFLEDDVIDSNESSVLVELILNVAAELTGKPIVNCPKCRAPVRQERVEASQKCPWCGAPFSAERGFLHGRSS